MTLISSNPTLIDVARASLPDGSIDRQMVDIISQTNDFFMDATVMEGNNPAGNMTTQITSEPTVSFRSLNAGVATSKGTSKQIIQTAGILEGNNQIDEDELSANGNTKAYRTMQDILFSRAMGKKMINECFYGNQGITPQGFDGFSTFYNAISTDETHPGYNVISCGGSSTDNYSMWLVCWDPMTVHLFYPKGTSAGLQTYDAGKVRVLDGSNNPYYAYCTNFKWKMGMAIKDHRYVVRLANIDKSDLLTYNATSDTSPNLLQYMTIAKYRLPELIGRCVWYANSTVMTYLEMMAKQNATWVSYQDTKDAYNRSVKQLMIDGFPVRRVDKLVVETTAIS